MPEVHHPAFKEIVVGVSSDALAGHLAAGWVEIEREELRHAGGAVVQTRHKLERPTPKK